MVRKSPWNSGHRRVSALSLVAWMSLVAAVNGADGRAISLSGTPTVDRVVTVKYSVDISGDISTPNAQGTQTFPISSVGEFLFDQKQFASQDVGPFALKCVRSFKVARTQTQVGKDHKTSVSLPVFLGNISLNGTGEGLQVWNSRRSMRSQHLELLQMPFDVLVAQELLPSSSVNVGDKWNVDSWVSPMLVGVDAVVEQSTTCQLESVDGNAAVVTFTGSLEGAIHGSASNVEYSGRLLVDRKLNLVTSLTATQKEKRSPGAVSPGLDVTAKIDWKQHAAPHSTLEDVVAHEAPEADSLLVQLETPLKLRLLHSREWHLFHETPAVLMMRQLRDGNLVSQCNISSTVTVSPGDHTPDREFRADVEVAAKERKGQVVEESTVRDDGKWRLRRVRAVGDAGGQRIHWDYYLCSAATGQQFSIVFSYAGSDQDVFGDEAEKLLATLSVVTKRLALPYR